MMVIFDQEEVGAIERRNFRKGVTVENREKTKNVIMRMKSKELLLILIKFAAFLLYNFIQL